MAPVPDVATLKAQLSGFDSRDTQLVLGLFALMIAHPERVREREWITEQYTRVSQVAHGLGEGDVSPEALARFRDHARDNVDRILNACYGLFARVGEELAREGAADTEKAMQRALAYFGEGAAPPPEV